ncbi:MAG: sigma-70 family RNA polymerase sigma factor, partial [Planctomycetota bacterium]
MSLATAMQKFQYDPSKSFRGWLRVVTNNAIHSFSKRNAKAGRGDGGSDVVSLLTSMESRQDLNERLQAEYDTELAEIAA